MTGSLQERNGKFVIVLSYKDDNQKWRTKWVSTGLDVKNNKRKAEKKLEEVLAQYQDVTNFKATEILFCDFVGEWIELHKSNIQATTYNGYKNIYNKHVYPYFKALGVTLNDLEAIHIHKYYAEKQAVLNPNSVLKHHALIRSSLQSAKKMGRIKENLADLVEKPKKQKFISDYFTQEEISNLLSVAKGSPIETAIVFACYYGLRRSEILGIKWSAIDFQNRTITIKHKIVPVTENGKFKLHSTDKLKTSSSYRALPINDKLYDYLIELRQKQEANRQLMGNSYNNEYSEYVCVNDMGKMLLPNYISKVFTRLQKENNFPKIIRFHDLRHSTASLLLSLGHNMKDIQWLLGHGDIGTTMNIYSHLGTNDKKNVVDGISNAITF